MSRVLRAGPLRLFIWTVRGSPFSFRGSLFWVLWGVSVWRVGVAVRRSLCCVSIAPLIESERGGPQHPAHGALRFRGSCSWLGEQFCLFQAERGISFTETRKIAAVENENRVSLGSRTAVAVVSSGSGPLTTVNVQTDRAFRAFRRPQRWTIPSVVEEKLLET